MTGKEAQQLAKRIKRDDPQCQVTSHRRWGTEDWELLVDDMRTGISFVIAAPEDWAERVKASEVYA